MKDRALGIVGKWQTWVILAAIVCAWLVYRNGRRWWAQLTNRDRGNYAGQSQVSANPAREAELEQMAQDVFVALNSTLMLGGVTATGREWTLERLLALNDTEIRWVAKRYAALAQGRSLRGDLENEWMPFSDVDERLIAKLQQLAL